MASWKWKLCLYETIRCGNGKSGLQEEREERRNKWMLEDGAPYNSVCLSSSWSQNITPHSGARRFFKTNKETVLCDINFDQSCFTICVRPAEGIFLGSGPFLNIRFVQFSTESVQRN